MNYYAQWDADDLDSWQGIERADDTTEKNDDTWAEKVLEAEKYVKEETFGCTDYMSLYAIRM